MFHETASNNVHKKEDGESCVFQKLSGYRVRLNELWFVIHNVLNLHD